MKLVYLSQGNIPSRWAHTVQAMKMAEALSALASDFRLVTQAHWIRLLAPRFDFETWYGIRRPFRIVRLPALRASARRLAERVYDRRFDRMAAWYASRLRPDWVYTRSPHAGALCVARGLRTIVETHGSEHDPAMRRLLRTADDSHLAALVTVSDVLKDAYRRAGIAESRILVWPDAVEPAQFAVTEDRAALRRRLNLPDPAVVALYAGHFYPYKGVDAIVEAASLAPEVQFVLVGGWPDDIARLRGAAATRPNLHVVGFVANADVPAWLAAADMLLLPNSARYPEARTTSPLKLFEYMAARRPIIASAIPALEGLLRNESNALVVPADSPSALAAAVRRLAADAALPARLAETAWNDVQAHTWSRRAAAVLDFAASRR